MKGKVASMLILSILFTSAFAICAERVQSSSEGLEPYIPLRLEWLAMELNSMHRTDTLINGLTGYSIVFIPLIKENAILILVQHTRKTNRQVMNIAIDAARKITEINAKSKGWNSWLKVREEIILLPVP